MLEDSGGVDPDSDPIQKSDHNYINNSNSIYYENYFFNMPNMMGLIKFLIFKMVIKRTNCPNKRQTDKET